jgi:short subunit dehydrogenase-like uncharacterized protein
MPRTDRPIDVLLWGATGFTGRLLADYIARNHSDLKVALGGRNGGKLERLKAELAKVDPRCASWVVHVADAHDATALDRIVPQVKAIASTAGPFLSYGRELVAACARHGTDYCDITGEVPFVREVIDLHDARAKETGARLVSFCGMDSIPSDLGVYAMQKAATEGGGEACALATFVLVRASGGISGGTVASMLVLGEQAAADARVREMLDDPYALAPRGGVGAHDAEGAVYDAELGKWTAPFLMGIVNSRVVHRTNALLDFPYGRAFRYEERVVMGSGARGWLLARGMSAGLAAAPTVLTLSPVRSLAKRFLPAPGEGPSEKQREGGFTIRITGRDGTGKLRATCTISGEKDPGYGETAKMLGESVVCLASGEGLAEGGALTPAVAMGDALLARLRARKMSFDVEVV